MQLLRFRGTSHYPVLHREVSTLVDQFFTRTEDTKPQLQMFDGTFGGGGHSVPLLETHSNLKVLGTDLDENLLE